MHERSHVSLAELTTIGLGGPAKRLIDIDDETELEQVLGELANESDEVFILGGGSNVIVSDGGWPGTVIRPAFRRFDATKEGCEVLLHLGAGEVWDDVVRECVQRRWAGVSCLSGIPGWVGASPIQNIGAYGTELSQVLVEVHAFDRDAKRHVIFPAADCALGYRSNRFRGNARHVIEKVVLRLRADGGDIIRYSELARSLGVREGASVNPAEVREAVLELRRGKGMVVDPRDTESRSAGSYFVNPIIDAQALQRLEARALELGIVTEAGLVPRYPNPDGRFKVPAAWLIEKAGFHKGMTVGGVGISKKHALALVNRGGATSDLLRLEASIFHRVMDRFGVRLQREPIFVGEEMEDTPKSCAGP